MVVFQDSEMRYPFDFRSSIVFNKGAVQLAQNPVTNSNSEHIDVRHHFLRELVRQRDIKVVQVPSGFQHADILTKA